MAPTSPNTNPASRHPLYPFPQWHLTHVPRGTHPLTPCSPWHPWHFPRVPMALIALTTCSPWHPWHLPRVPHGTRGTYPVSSWHPWHLLRVPMAPMALTSSPPWRPWQLPRVPMSPWPPWHPHIPCPSLASHGRPCWDLPHGASRDWVLQGLATRGGRWHVWGTCAQSKG